MEHCYHGAHQMKDLRKQQVEIKFILVFIWFQRQEVHHLFHIQLDKRWRI